MILTYLLVTTCMIPIKTHGDSDTGKSKAQRCRRQCTVTFFRVNGKESVIPENVDHFITYCRNVTFTKNLVRLVKFKK